MRVREKEKESWAGGRDKKEREGCGAYVGAVAGTDDETAIEHELHVACPRGFRARGGDVLADVGCRSQNLRLADVVVFNIDHFQEIADVFVLVHDLTDCADEVDDRLCHPVARGGFPAKDGNTRRQLFALFGAHGFDGEIAVDDSEYVQLLSLVLVYPFDLDVEESLGVHADSGRLLDVLRQADLIRVFDLLPFLLESLVIQESLELVQLGQVSQEVITPQLRRNQLRQTWVGLVKPSAWCDPVGDVCEFIWAIDGDKVLEDGRTDQIRVELGHTIDLVASNGGEMGHSDHLWLSLLDD